jgi:hypothetical protein
MNDYEGYMRAATGRITYIFEPAAKGRPLISRKKVSIFQGGKFVFFISLNNEQQSTTG